MEKQNDRGEREKLGSYTFEAEEIKHFAARHRPAPEHSSEAPAKDPSGESLCASDWHVATIGMRLLVQRGAYAIGNRDGNVNPYGNDGPGAASRNLRGTGIVRAGDTVTYYKETLARRPSECSSGWEDSTFKVIGVNQNGREVYEVELTATVYPGT